MKVIINGYDVEIKAKRNGKKQMNLEDTRALLNWLTGYAYEAADSYEKRNRPALAEDARETARNIFTALETVGYYK